MNSEVPELRNNQFGVTVKCLNEGELKTIDEILYFTVNKNNISLELYPKRPIILIDKDIAKAILTKIIEIDDLTGTNKNDC